MYFTGLFCHFLKVLAAQQYVFHCSFLSFSESLAAQQYVFHCSFLSFSESLGCSTVCISLFFFVIF